MFAATARHVPHAHVGLSGLLFEFQNIEPRLAEISRVKFRCEPKHSLEVLELLDCAGSLVQQRFEKAELKQDQQHRYTHTEDRRCEPNPVIDQKPYGNLKGCAESLHLVDLALCFALIAMDELKGWRPPFLLFAS